MKKFYTFLAAVAATFAMNATTLTWNASDLSGLANNEVLNGLSFDLNSNISMSLDKDISDKDIIFKKTSSAPTTVNVYAKGIITFTATEATITSIKFIVNTDQGTSNTPGWNLTGDNGTAYTADNDTWTGSATTVTFTDKSAIQIIGLEIEFETENGDSGNTGNEGESANIEWLASSLTQLSNNEVLNGLSFDINEYISFSLDLNGSDKDIIFKKTNSVPNTINVYSKGMITFTATNATINSIKFVVNTDQGTSNTPGWNLTGDNGTAYTADNDTWTGSATTVTFTDKSAIQIIGLIIDYTIEGTGSNPGDEGDEGDDDENGTNVEWLSSNLTELSNNDVLNGLSFDINEYISFSLDLNGSDKDIIFKKTNSAPTTINVYSKGIITFTATNATITSIQFVVNTDQGTSNTPGWNLTGDNGTAYTADNDTWTGSATTVTFTDKSAIQIIGLNITYVTESGPTGGVENIVKVQVDGPAYDLNGRIVSDDYKGIVIQNGKKFIRK